MFAARVLDFGSVAWVAHLLGAAFGALLARAQRAVKRSSVMV
ncbi:hypothetical protein [Xylella taiwanensis]|nr:hypothetical protein [Xylella taiwanensis]